MSLDYTRYGTRQEDFRKAAAISIMERSLRAEQSPRGTPALTYKQAYDKVLQREASGETAFKILVSVAGAGTGTAIVRAGLYYIARNPWTAQAGVDFIGGVIPGSAPVATPEAVGAVGGSKLYEWWNSL